MLLAFYEPTHQLGQQYVGCSCCQHCDHSYTKPGLRYLTCLHSERIGGEGFFRWERHRVCFKAPPGQSNALQAWQMAKNHKDHKGRRASRGIRREEQLTSPFPLDSHIFICDRFPLRGEVGGGWLGRGGRVHFSSRGGAASDK